MVWLSLLEPFSVVKYMFSDGGVCIDPKDIKQFWNHHCTVGSPWASGWEAAAEKQHVPLGLFGDAAKVRQLSYQKAEKMLGIFLNAPLWRPRSCRAARWLLFAIREEDLFENKTLDAVYHHICWSLNCLYDDKYPSTGPRGQELTGKQKERAGKSICGGLKFCVTELRADWLYHRQCMRFSSSWKAGVHKGVCFLCPAMTHGAERYWDIELSSPIWDQQFTLNQFVVQQLPENPCC